MMRLYIRRYQVYPRSHRNWKQLELESSLCDELTSNPYYMVYTSQDGEQMVLHVIRSIINRNYEYKK